MEDKDMLIPVTPGCRDEVLVQLLEAMGCERFILLEMPADMDRRVAKLHSRGLDHKQVGDTLIDLAATYATNITHD